MYAAEIIGSVTPQSLGQCRTRPAGIGAVVLSTQHDPDISLEAIREAVMDEIIKPVLPAEWLDQCPQESIHINPTGRFVVGGPMGDCGLTGRKIIVDTYGGMARHGGGAFSGKDPSKVDRSAAYASRYVAKNIVAAGLAERSLLAHLIKLGEDGRARAADDRWSVLAE